MPTHGVAIDRLAAIGPHKAMSARKAGPHTVDTVDHRTPKAARIRAARIARGLTQFDLARAIDVLPTTVSRWERGAVEPRAEVLAKLAELLGVTPQYIDYGDVPRPHIESIDVVPPQFQEWLESPLAHGVTEQEIETLRGFRFPYGHPGVGWYSVALAAMRAGTLGVPSRPQ